MLNWFYFSWWKYLFHKINWADWREINPFAHVACRAKGHPQGVVWYNPSGLEPDMHCKNCGDDLG